MHLFRYVLPVLMFGIGLSAQAATSVSGSLLSDTTWDTSGSPYSVDGDLTLYPGYTLTIEPGVAVTVAAGVDLDIRGLLDIQGTETAPVTITGSVNPTADWTNTSADGIRINADEGGSLSATYVEVSHLHTGFQIDCCYASDLTFSISDSTFSENTVGLFVYDGPNTVVVERSTFQNNTFAVKGVDTSISESTFSGNTYGLHFTSGVNVTCSEFTDNEQGITSASSATLSYSSLTNNGVALDDPWSSFTMTNNAITDNETGLYTESAGTSFTSNAIYNNTTWNVRNGTTSGQALDSNWWNTTVVSDITATIYDGFDESGLGLVTVEPVLTEAVDTTSVCSAAEDTEDDEVDDTAPAEVRNVRVHKKIWSQKLVLRWVNSLDSDFDHVLIRRIDSTGKTVTVSKAETDEEFTDDTVEYGEQYTYSITAVDTTGNESVAVLSVPKSLRSPHPRHITLQAKGDTVHVSWQRLPERFHQLSGYMVYYGTDPDDLNITYNAGTKTSAIMDGLVTGHTYYVAVAAYNRGGFKSPLSNIKSVDAL